MQKIPFIHRKPVGRIMEGYEPAKSSFSEITNFKDYLNFRRIGTEDGWLLTNNRECQALRWLENNASKVRELRINV